MSFICKFICKCAIKENSNLTETTFSDSDEVANENDVSRECSMIDTNILAKNKSPNNNSIILSVDSVDSKMITEHIINPLQNKNVKLYHYNVSDLTNWECAICFENINSENATKNLCIPYNCRHLTCYECFVDYINYKKKVKDNIHLFNCSLCRKPITQYWKKSEKISKSLIEHSNIKFNYIFPVA